MAREQWDMNGAMEYVKDRAIRFVGMACIEVERRAKQLLSVPGTGTAEERVAARLEITNRVAKSRADVKEWNRQHAKEIKTGELKRRRVTKLGYITDRKKHKKTKPPQGGSGWLGKKDDG